MKKKRYAALPLYVDIENSLRHISAGELKNRGVRKRGGWQVVEQNN